MAVSRYEGVLEPQCNANKCTEDLSPSGDIQAGFKFMKIKYGQSKSPMIGIEKHLSLGTLREAAQGWGFQFTSKVRAIVTIPPNRLQEVLA